MWTYRCPPSAPATAPAAVSEHTSPAPVRPSAPPPAAAPTPPSAPAPAKARPLPASALPARRLPRPRLPLLPAFAYLIGLAGGAVLASAVPALEPFLTLYGQNLPQAQGGIGAELLFSTTFLGHMGILLGLLLAGLCALGAPLILLLMLLRGVWESGYILSLYADSSWQGLALYTVVFWLPGLVFTVLQLAFSLDARRMSKLLRKNCLAGGVADLPASVRRFLSRFLLFGGLGIAAALLQVAFWLLLGPILL